jgi:hypothetical protein
MNTESMTMNTESMTMNTPENSAEVGIEDKIIELLVDALQTDGAHHKQWYLNEVLTLIDKEIAKEVEGWTGDAGIAP